MPRLNFIKYSDAGNGWFEFLDELQKSIDLKSNENTIEIVLLSSSRHHLDEARAKEYPVLGCIEKPITEEKLTKFLS